MDIDFYSDCLTHGYRFEFDPADWAQAGVTPDEPWWSRADDLKSMGSLFEYPGVSSIEAVFPVESGGYVGDVYTVKCGGDIRISFDDPGAEDPLVYRIHSSWFHFKIGPDESEPGLFKIVEMKEDYTYALTDGAGPVVEPSTLGGIKTMFK
jgi:hypothetical protein